MSKTRIEWTETTWNPVTGCTPVSEGCEHCYARRTAKRFAGRFGYPKDDPFRVTLHRDKLFRVPGGKPKRVFVCSMGDLFHEEVSFDSVGRVIIAMAYAPQHTYQVLTKRPSRMVEYFERQRDMLESGGMMAEAVRSGAWPLDNLWLGVTAENQETADQRIPLLLQTPAAVRFVSLEPLLSPVDISPYLGQAHADSVGLPYKGDDPWYAGLDWVIVGGETGPGARPMYPNWVRKVRDDCRAAGVSFFFKGWGAWRPGRSEWAADSPLQSARWHETDGRLTEWGYAQANSPHYVDSSGAVLPLGKSPASAAVFMTRVGKKKAGRLLDGRTWEQYPETKK